MNVITDPDERHPMSVRRGNARGWVAAVGYVGTVVAANWAIRRFGVVPVGFGLTAPAGVYFVSVALVFRDYVQWALGKAVMLAALITGVAVSYTVAGPGLATASAAAFLLSELVDFALFTWVAPRWASAVLIGGLVGALLDSVVFLHLAYGSFAYLPGQLLGKGYGVVAAALVIAVVRRRRAGRV